jgi:hypothetical protein
MMRASASASLLLDFAGHVVVHPDVIRQPLTLPAIIPRVWPNWLRNQTRVVGVEISPSSAIYVTLKSEHQRWKAKTLGVP